jgi:hypothetical protein
MFARRLSIITGATTAAVLLSSGAALAHGCYFTNPNPNADANRAHTKAFMSFTDMAHMFIAPDFCAEGIEILAEAAGITPETMINGRGMMAGGSGGNKAIQHMDFAGLEANMQLAMDTCYPPAE